MTNRKRSKTQKADWSKKLFIFIGPLFFALCALPSNAFCDGEAKWTEILAKIPVQQGGRVKPFETFAREAVLYATGRTAWKKEPAVQTVWGWIANPGKWSAQAVIYVGPPQLRTEFGLKLINNRVSPDVVLGEKDFTQKVQDAARRKQARQTVSFLDEKRIDIYERASFLSQLSQGDLPGWIPEPQNPQGAWVRFADFSDPAAAAWMKALPKTEMQAFKKAAEFLAEILNRPGATETEKTDAAKDFQRALEAVWSRAGMAVDAGLLNHEIFYNRLHAFGRGSKLYLLATLFFFLAMFSKRKRKSDQEYSARLGFFAYAGALILHTLGFYLRCSISGRAPVTNMYESIVWVSLAAAIFSVPIFIQLRHLSVLIISSLVAALGLLVAESFPAVLDPALSPLVPVLRSNLWLTVHVLTITMSYGAFALAWGLGHAVVFGYAFPGFKAKSETLTTLANAVYRATQIGVILLAAGTVLGGVWANYSWGRFWGWDPKETWALIALLGYLVVLHGRFIGWFGSFGIAMGSIIAFMGVVMAWYGVNFVLAAGLHSYGFGGGGYLYVSGVLLIDMILTGFAAWVYQTRNKK